MKKNLLFLSLLATSLMLTGCGKGSTANNGGGNSSGGSDSGNTSGSTSSENTRDYANVYFFIDYNNIDPEHPYQKVQVKWGSKITKPADPTTPPDPAFPTFLGWSERTVVDNPQFLYNFDTVVKSRTFDIYLYGIWVSA